MSNPHGTYYDKICTNTVIIYRYAKTGKSFPKKKGRII